MLITYILIGLLAGFAIANMTPINAGLRKKIGSPLIAIVISILISTLVMLIATLLTGQNLWPDMSFVTSHSPIIWIGGVIGAIYVTSNILMLPKIVAIETVVFPFLG